MQSRWSGCMPAQACSTGPCRAGPSRRGRCHRRACRPQARRWGSRPPGCCSACLLGREAMAGRCWRLREPAWHHRCCSAGWGAELLPRVAVGAACELPQAVAAPCAAGTAAWQTLVASWPWAAWAPASPGGACLQLQGAAWGLRPTSGCCPPWAASEAWPGRRRPGRRRCCCRRRSPALRRSATAWR
jgi:hypothetical protein